MARNEEKGQSQQNRFITMKQEEKQKPRERRPYLTSECRDLADAYRWRTENEGLGEHRLRGLNDEINKLLRELTHWEGRILELGGHDYTRSSNADLDDKIVSIRNPSGSGPGYRYFGAANKLPGVREIFDEPPKVCKRRSHYEIHKRINVGYYGYYDDVGGVLEPREVAVEKRMRDGIITESHCVERVRREAVKNGACGEKAKAGWSGGEVARELLFEEVEEEVEEERRLEEEEKM